MTEQDWAGRGFTGPPVSLREALRVQLADRGPMALRDVEAHFPYTERRSLIAELARMRDDGEVEFTGPRYKLVDRQAGN